MYGHYLKEASAILNIPQLVNIGEKFLSIGKRWQDVAQIFRRGFDLANPADVLPETTVPIMTIAKMEEDAWGQLLVIVG